MPSSYTPASGIGGTTGTTDNAITRADGTAGSMLQGSTLTIDDAGNVNSITSLGLPNSGKIYSRGGGCISFDGSAGLTGLLFEINPNGVIEILQGCSLAFSRSGITNLDIFLVPDAANTLALRNGANGQTWIVSRTFTDASNKSEATLVCTGTVAAFTITEAGTGIGTLTKWTFNKNVSLPTLNISAIPTSSSGLSSGDVWSNLGILTIVS